MSTCQGEEEVEVEVEVEVHLKAALAAKLLCISFIARRACLEEATAPPPAA